MASSGSTREGTAVRRAVAASVAVTAFISSPAFAQSDLRDALFGSRGMESRRSVAPPSARYVSETGLGFIFDRTQGRGLIRFDGNPEVFVLEPQSGPRGDIIYKNDLGAPVLRATKVGGMTLFTRQQPDGTAAALMGAAPMLRLAPMGPAALLQRLSYASGLAGRAAQRTIRFDADASPGSAALMADAAIITAEAMARIARRPDGRKVLARIDRVLLVEGKKPSANISKGLVKITICPEMGLAGRPSSERIAHVAGVR